MSEEESIDGLSPNDRKMAGLENDTPNVLEGESREPSEEGNNVDKTLKSLRERRESDDSPQITIQDGITLIRAEILDLEASGEGDDEQTDILRTMPDMLIDIMSGDTSEWKYDDIKQMRAYFRSRKKIWDGIAHRPFQASEPVFSENRDIYGAVLTEVNKKLPTPESVLPEFPEYDLRRIEPLLEPLREKGKVKIKKDLIPLYKDFALDVSETKKQAKAEHPQWTRQKNGIQLAMDLWKGTTMDKRKPLLVISEPPAEMRVEPYDNTLPSTPDNGFVFIIDPEEDVEYIHDIAAFDKIDAIAQNGVAALKELETDSPSITGVQLDEIRLLTQLLQEGLMYGKIDMKYRDLLTKLHGSLHKKAVEALQPRQHRN